MPGMSAPALSDIQRRLSSSGKPPAPAHAPSSVPFQVRAAPALGLLKHELMCSIWRCALSPIGVHIIQMPAESENEDAQGYLSGHLSGSGLETADEDPEVCDCHPYFRLNPSLLLADSSIPAALLALIWPNQHDPSSEYEREDREADLYTATAIKSGYLHKKGERRRAWKKRFFVLRPRSLGYYKDSKEYKLLRQIPLLDIRTCAQVEVKKHDYVFGIVTKERTFYIQTSSTHERDEWVQAINTAIKQAKVMDQVQSESPLTEDLGDSETPQARASPGLTTPQQQQQQHQSPTTQPIAIAGASSSRSSGHLATNSTKATAPVVPNSSFQPHSLASITTGSSGFSPGALSPQAVAGDIPSSYTSQPSVGTQASSFGAGAPGAPPNSYALSPSEAFQQYDLANVDATLQQIQGAQQVTPELPASADKQRQYSNSSVSDANDPASAPRWFGQAAAGVASPGRPLSPGGGSSSEDEDDELGEMPVTPISSSFHQDPDALSARAAFQRRFSTGNTAQSKLKAQPGPAQMHHPESDKIILAGYLTKQGKRRNWRKRWFSLSNTSLSYSRSHMVNTKRMTGTAQASTDHHVDAGCRTRKCTTKSHWSECWTSWSLSRPNPPPAAARARAMTMDHPPPCLRLPTPAARSTSTAFKSLHPSAL